MAKASEPPSGTRDLLADEVRRRQAAFNTISAVFERYGFDPLQTPAFERLEVLTGKYGDEGDKLVFKILRRGAHEATGEADLALRYDHTVPLARVVGTYGTQLPAPYKRYVIGPVWRADRPARGRFREFTQVDADTIGSASLLADVEVLMAINDAITDLGIEDFQFLLNSRRALYGLLDAYDIRAEQGPQILGTLDKLDKLEAQAVIDELQQHGLDATTAEGLIEDLTATDTERIRTRLETTEQGREGLAEIDRMLALAHDLPTGRIAFQPAMVRGLDYYTGLIWEVNAPGYPGSIASGGRYDGLVSALGGPDLPGCGGSIGIERILSAQTAASATDNETAAGLDVALTVLGAEETVMQLASRIRTVGLRTGIYLGSSGKIGRQLAWADNQSARFAVLHGPEEQATGEATIRDMRTGDQVRLPLGEVPTHLRARFDT